MPQKTQSTDRDKFFPLEGPFAPFSIPAWHVALQAVDRSPHNLIETCKLSMHSGHFTFPDPGLFVSPTADEKKSLHIQSWLQIHDASLMRLQMDPFLAMSSQHWRTFLSMDLSVPVQGSTKAAKRRQEVFNMLLPTLRYKHVVSQISCLCGRARNTLWECSLLRMLCNKFYGSCMN